MRARRSAGGGDQRRWQGEGFDVGMQPPQRITLLLPCLDHRLGCSIPGQPRAQFMYQNAAGERMTLYVGALKVDPSGAAGDTAFRFLDEGPVPGFYWVERGFGYAIAGKLPRPALQELATAVYRQL